MFGLFPNPKDLTGEKNVDFSGILTSINGTIEDEDKVVLVMGWQV